MEQTICRPDTARGKWESMSLCNLVKQYFTVKFICPLTFSVKEIFKSFVTVLNHIWCGEAVGAQQSKLQQLLCQPISCFLKLDITVNSQYCPGLFSQHKAMMGHIFLRDPAFMILFTFLFSMSRATGNHLCYWWMLYKPKPCLSWPGQHSQQVLKRSLFICPLQYSQALACGYNWAVFSLFMAMSMQFGPFEMLMTST